MNSDDIATFEASAAIAKVLRDLETKTGRAVNRVDVREVSYRSFGEPSTRHLRTVEIDLGPRPAEGWGS